jgi:phage protein D/phage baseplate assembly protein gpV
MTNTLLSQFYVKLSGADASPDFMGAVESIVVESTLHLPSMATLRLHDPHLVFIDSSAIAIGTEITVSTGKETLFDGEIVELEPEFSDRSQSLVIRAFDRLHRLAHGNHTRTFLNVKDSDLVSKLAGEVGLQSKATATSEVFPHVFQNNQSNLAFLQERAARLGFVLYVSGKQLYCQEPAPGAEVGVQWGVSLTSFRPRMVAGGHLGKATVRSWDYKTKKEIVGQASTPTSPAVPSIGVTYKQPFTFATETQVSDCRVKTQAAAQKLAQAHLDRHSSQYIEAEGACLGEPKLRAGVKLKVENVGTRFSGVYLVTEAIHRYEPLEGYTTEFRVSGMNASNLLAQLLPEPEQAGRLAGLMVGIVTDNLDPEKLGRVKVKLPWLSNDHATDWVRVVSVGGGATRGIAFVPEVNDEVLVGFEQGDINQAFVLGGLWNGKDAPPYTQAEALKGGKVAQRVIASRTGHKIILNDSDDKPSVTIVDKSGNTIVLDSTANKLEITTKGDISVKTNANASVEAQGNLTLKATGNLALEAQGNLTLKATGNLSAEASAKAELKGNAGADVQSPGIVNVKGSMINLN